MRDVLLREGGIYTLWGTKPISSFDISYQDDELLSEKEKWYNRRLRDNWEKFKDMKWCFPLNRYQLIETLLGDKKETHRIYFVNIIETARVLKEHYPIFATVGETDFDPIEIVYAMEKKETRFWEKVLMNPLTLGILYGYGKENASYFSWGKEGNNPLQSLIATSVKGAVTPECPSYYNPTLANMPLPQFTSFFLYDPVVNKYEEERKAIQAVYKKGGFLDLTLTKLTF